MKIVVIGDPHIKANNIPEVDLFISKLVDLLKSETPDFIVILGDILNDHEKLNTIALNKAVELFEKCSTISHTFVLVGNHDIINNSQFLTENHWLNPLKKWPNMNIVDKVIHIEREDFNFTFLPYVPPGRFRDALDTIPEESWKKSDVIFCHQEFKNCKMNTITSIEGDTISEDYPYIVSGHIHNRQTIGEKVYYPGSSMQTAFGESDKNIIAILSWKKPGKKYKLQEVDLGLPRKKIVYADVQTIEDYVPETNSDKVKITLSGVYDEFKAFKKTKKYKELVNCGTKVVFKAKKITKEQVEKNKEDIQGSEERDFNVILSNLVSKEKNKFLYQAFELVINSKEIEDDDVLFV